MEVYYEFKKNICPNIIFFFMILLAPDVQARRYGSYSRSARYIAPSREIVISPYGGFIYAKDLYTDYVDDQSGFGGGISISTQLYKNFGYMVDVFIPRVDILDDNSTATTNSAEKDTGPQFVAIYTGGFYYKIPHWKFDLCYGAISAGVNIMTIFVPSVEFYKFVSPRVSLFAKVGSLITNDWFSDMGYEEKYTSFMASAGFSIVF